MEGKERKGSSKRKLTESCPSSIPNSPWRKEGKKEGRKLRKKVEDGS